MVNADGSGTGARALLEPFSNDNFCCGVGVALVPALTSCVIARSPQYNLGEVFGYKLLPLDAISLIVAAPLFFVAVSWLLKRLAERMRPSPTPWKPGDIRVVAFLTGLFGACAVFLLLQFFVVLAPEKQCDSGPHFRLLWSTDSRDLQIQHCMSSAAAINKQAWHYLQPAIVQAWLNVGLVGVSLYLLWDGWRTWRKTITLATPAQVPPRHQSEK